MPGVRRRMILAPVPRERERWYALWLLTQGWTAQATAEALERDPHTIGRWASAFGEGGPAALIFEQTGGSPRPRSGAAGDAERGGAGVARQLRRGTGQLELESGLPVRLRALRYQPEPQHLPQLSAPAGILLQTPPRNGCSRLMWRNGRSSWQSTPPCRTRRGGLGPRYSSLTRPTFVRTPKCGANGCCVESRPWWTRAARAMAKRPATIRRCAWRPARWNGWNWRGAATQEHRQPSWDSCGRGTAVVWT